eukprot:TRINITY_DN94056_c0_g1_i1.p1 TRINITY_DN94056_c0_g1~~TRINITY_DN94056_c0_g1_i1.p1  ORF type:complete len:532 (-),score=67.49 TRINITY_DN94056_c0_g1_i1:270-1805(-)
MSLKLAGLPLAEVNRISVGLASSLIALTCLGLLIDAKCPKIKRKLNEYLPAWPAWCLTLLVSSYLLFVPAMFATLFSLHIGAFDSISLKELSETTVGFIHLLSSTGCWLGAIMVTLFAIAIPVMKVGLLILGERWRRSPDRRRVIIARRSIAFVQFISKWACPDMIAYILLQYLVKTLDHPSKVPNMPGTLNGLFELDAGFTCYTLFCWGSTLSSLGVVLPISDEPMPDVVKPPEGRSGVFRLRASFLVLLAVSFATCLGVGLTYSCMSLRLDIQALTPMLVDTYHLTEEQIPALVDSYHLLDLAKADVTIPRCIEKIVTDMLNKFEFNGILALIMMALFVIGFAVLGMMAILLSFVQFHQGIEQWCHTLRLAEKLKKLAMLDVTIVGVCVVVASGTVYKSEGLILALQPGILGLVGAQVSYEMTYWLVTCWCTLRCEEVPPAMKIDVDLERATTSTEAIASVVPDPAEVADSVVPNSEKISQATLEGQEADIATGEVVQRLEECSTKASL